MRHGDDAGAEVFGWTALTLPRSAHSDGSVRRDEQESRSRDDPMRLASYVEAQLIIAEAQTGNTAVNIINARPAELNPPQYTGPTDNASIMALVLE